MANGGPAFPRAGCQWTEDQGDGAWAQEGMSLREYFAAAALPGVIAARVALMNANLATDLNQESIAEEAFELADAMLAESVK